MQLSRGDGCVRVQAPAKLNLFLEVLAKRPDGFHEIETLMTPVSWYDTLTLEDDSSGRLSLQCEYSADARPPSVAGAPRPETEVPEGSDNLVLRALEALRRQTGCRRGARVRLTKRIPVAAGLAGGSTDAAAALAAADRLWDLGLGDGPLCEIAATLGSDIPFFFARRPAVCRGRGERIEALEGLGTLHGVIVAPPVGLSTAAVYRACRPAETPATAGEIAAAWRAGDAASVGRLLHNRLQPAAEGLNECVGRLREEFDRFDCLGHRMSGSGTSYFALCRTARQARALAAQASARRLGRTFTFRSLAA